MLVLIRGGQTAYTKGIPSGFVPADLNVVNKEIGQVPVPVVLWVGLNVIIAFVLFATPYGRRVYAVGSNREAARLSGTLIVSSFLSHPVQSWPSADR
jgi:ribose/xylose/arabinose/galactoside ABC-type transport system permease subunit